MKRLLIAFACLGMFCCSVWAQPAWNTNQHVITYVPHSPCAGVPIAFGIQDTSGQYQHPIRLWDFGDGGQAYTNLYWPSPTHVYAAPGDYLLAVNVHDSITIPPDSNRLWIHVDSVCGAMDNVSGKLFQDTNGDGIQQVTEQPWPYRIVEFNPGPYYVSTDFNGNYGFNVDPGTYTVTSPLPLYQSLTTPLSGSYTVTTTGANSIIGGNDFGFAPASNSINDLRIYGWFLPQVPGFTREFILNYQNVGTTVQSATIALNYPASLAFVSAQNGGTQSGNTVSWALPTLAPGTWGTVACSLMVPVGTPIGTPLNFTATIDPIPGDTTQADNVLVINKDVVGSWDPNAKEVAPAGTGTAGEVPPGTPLTYTIHFQNTGNFPATNVVLRDTLDADLDLTTLEVLSGSHPFQWYLEMDRLTFDFPNIMLPDSTSNEPQSHGHVVYRIQHKASAGLGTVITNTASIYFDFNAPVVTNTTVTTLANPVAVNAPEPLMQLRAIPNPSDGLTRIRFENPEQAACSLLLYDASGRLVLTQHGLTTEEYALDASRFPAGLYTLRLIAAHDRQASLKLMVR